MRPGAHGACRHGEQSEAGNTRSDQSVEQVQRTPPPRLLVVLIGFLPRAHIRTVMVTGDNLLTALSVARECGIIRPNKTAYLVEHRTDEFDSKGRPLLTLRQVCITLRNFTANCSTRKVWATFVKFRIVLN